MTDWTSFATLLATCARRDKIGEAKIGRDSVLFGAGLNLSSIAFLEFIMALEEDSGQDIDVDGLDETIRTAGQLYARLFPQDRATEVPNTP